MLQSDDKSCVGVRHVFPSPLSDHKVFKLISMSQNKSVFSLEVLFPWFIREVEKKVVLDPNKRPRNTMTALMV